MTRRFWLQSQPIVKPATSADLPRTLDLERFLPYRLSVLANTMSTAIAGAYAERFQLSIPEWRVLAVLARNPDLSAAQVAQRLGREPLVIGDPAIEVRNVAWCTGAAQDMLDEAIAAGAQAFVSGEISERTTHLAREAGVLYLAAGHHATERFGVQALGQRLAAEFGVEHTFIDDPNPA